MEVATIKRMATVMIKFKIEKGQFSEEDKKVAIQVLKQRRAGRFKMGNRGGEGKNNLQICRVKLKK